MLPVEKRRKLSLIQEDRRLFYDACLSWDFNALVGSIGKITLMSGGTRGVLMTSIMPSGNHLARTSCKIL